MPSSLQGLNNLVANLNYLALQTSKKAGRAGINAALTVFAKQSRKEINSSPASPSAKRAARKTISKRLKRAGIYFTTGKVGFGAGPQRKSKKAKAAARAKDKSRRGVGISSSNIHWFVLGTKERQTASGKSTGAMPKIFDGVIQRAVQSSLAKALDAAQKKIAQVIAVEAAKMKKG